MSVETRFIASLPPMQPAQTPIFSVSEFNRMIHAWVEQTCPPVWISGEIANFICSTNGHCYFSLKDERAQIKCVLFKPQLFQLKCKPKNGMHVFIYGQPSLYEARGDFQLIVSQVEEKGLGALQEALKKLKEKLFKEGLFDEKRKKPIPLMPETIGVITSAAGAAFHDVKNVLERRWPLAMVILYPASVQGEAAVPEMVHALELANQQKECEVLILCRGGGATEDLSAFNNEQLVHAMAKSQIPIVTGVGHAIDLTLADLVADKACVTPTEAAECVSSIDQNSLLQELENQQRQIVEFFSRAYQSAFHHLKGLSQRLDWCHPKKRLSRDFEKLDRFQKTLCSLYENQAQSRTARLEHLANLLSALNPLNILSRGYSVLTRSDGHIIRQSNEVKIGESIAAKLSEGQLQCRVEKVE